MSFYDDESLFVKANLNAYGDDLEVWKVEWDEFPLESSSLTFQRTVSSGDYFKDDNAGLKALSQNNFLKLVRYLRLTSLLVNCEGKLLVEINSYFLGKKKATSHSVDASGVVVPFDPTSDPCYLRCLDGFNWQGFGLGIHTTFDSTPVNLSTGVKLETAAPSTSSDGKSAGSHTDSDEDSDSGSDKSGKGAGKKNEDKAEVDRLKQKVKDLNADLKKVNGQLGKLSGLEKHRSEILKILTSCKTTADSYETNVELAKNEPRQANHKLDALQGARSIRGFCLKDWPLSSKITLDMVYFWRSTTDNGVSTRKYEDRQVRNLTVLKRNLTAVINVI